MFNMANKSYQELVNAARDETKNAIKEDEKKLNFLQIRWFV